MQRYGARNAVIALCLVCRLCLGQQNSPDSATYESFFEQFRVAQSNSGGTILLNGQDTGLVQPSVQKSMGLTDLETETLGNLSDACLANIRSFDAAMHPLVLEVRLQLIDSDEATRARLTQRLNEIKDRRDQIIRACVDDLRHRFSEPRFQVVQTYVGSRPNRGYFPPVAK